MKIVRKKKKNEQFRSEAVSPETERLKRELMKKKRKKRIKRRTTIFLFLLVCVGIIVAVLKAPLFNIKTVYCVGQQQMTEEEILEIAQVETGKNIFKTNIKAVDKRLANNPRIAEFNVRRIFPNKVKIWVKESKAVIFAEQENKFLLADSKGKIIEVLAKENQEENPQLARVEGLEVISANPGERLFAENDGKNIEFFKCVEVLSELNMLERVNYINFSDLSDIQIDYENRLHMLLGDYENLEYKLKFSRKVIEENISEYEKALFDYRGDRLYVGPPEGSAETEKEDVVEEVEEENTQEGKEVLSDGQEPVEAKAEDADSGVTE